MAIGWEVKFCDLMQYTDGQDLVQANNQDYDYVIRSDNGQQQLAPIVVDPGDYVESDLSRVSDPLNSILAITEEDTSGGPDVSPDEQFDDPNCDTGNSERWTAVHDFIADTNSAGTSNDAHPVICIRVNPFTSAETGFTDYERFCAFVTDSEDDGEESFGQLVLEFIFQGNDQRTYTYFVELSALDENPFDNTSVLYRVQIIEEKFWTGFSVGMRWKAEVWNLQTNTRVGSLGPVDEDEIKQNAKNPDDVVAGDNYSRPPLAHSRLMFGFGTGTEGTIRTKRVATSFRNRGDTRCIDPAISC